MKKILERPVRYSPIMENLIVCQMALDNVDSKFIRAFRILYPHFAKNKRLTAKDMEQILGFAKAGAHTIRRFLEYNGYIQRLGMSNWSVRNECLTHPLLTSILSLNVKTKKVGEIYVAEVVD